MIRTGSCALLMMLTGAAAAAQQAPQQDLKPLVPLLDSPRIFDSSVRAPNGVRTPGPKFRVVPIPGLRRPYGMAFLPDGRMLVSERAGQIRIVDHDKVDPQPVSGVPAVLDVNLRGMNNIVLREVPPTAAGHVLQAASDTARGSRGLARARYDGNMR